MWRLTSGDQSAGCQVSTAAYRIARTVSIGWSDRTSHWIGYDDPVQNGNTRSVEEQVLVILSLSMRSHAGWRRSLGFLEQEDDRH
jgi:hypothetical protein